MKTERVRYELYDNRMKTIETKNLKKTGESLTWVSLLSYFHCCILENYPDERILIINRDKYNEIRKQVLK